MGQEKLKDWIEVVGIFALVASLVFVGMQMKQTQEIAIAQQYQERAIYGAEHVGSYAENENLLRATVNDIEGAFESGELGDSLVDDYETFGAEYVALSVIMASKGLVTLDNYYFQYQQGFMEEEAWTAFRHRFKKSFGDIYMQTMYLDDPHEWRESFQDLCNELLAEIAAETQTNEEFD